MEQRVGCRLDLWSHDVCLGERHHIVSPLNIM